MKQYFDPVFLMCSGIMGIICGVVFKDATTFSFLAGVTVSSIVSFATRTFTNKSDIS